MIGKGDVSIGSLGVSERLTTTVPLGVGECWMIAIFSIAFFLLVKQPVVYDSTLVLIEYSVTNS